MKTRLCSYIVAATVAVLLLSSCVGTITHEKDPTTGKQKTDATVAMGGVGSKSKTTTTSPNGTVTVLEQFSYDNRESFKDGTKVPIATAVYGFGEAGVREGFDFARKVTTKN